MKQFIVDSTYKDAVVVDNNEFPTIISNNNITYNSGTDFNLNQSQYNYIGHHNKNDKFNNYNMIDYL